MNPRIIIFTLDMKVEGCNNSNARVLVGFLVVTVSYLFFGYHFQFDCEEYESRAKKNLQTNSPTSM